MDNHGIIGCHTDKYKDFHAEYQIYSGVEDEFGFIVNDPAVGYQQCHEKDTGKVAFGCKGETAEDVKELGDSRYIGSIVRYRYPVGY